MDIYWSKDTFAKNVVLAIIIFFIIINLLFLTQKSYMINYLGVDSKGLVIDVDSTHEGYYKYQFNYKIRLKNGEKVKISEGNYKKKTHQIGEAVNVKTYKKDSEFSTPSPNLYMAVPLLCILGIFTRIYFVFRKSS